MEEADVTTRPMQYLYQQGDDYVFVLDISGSMNDDGKLDVNETWIYVATGTAVEGQYANIGDVTQTHALLHGEESAVFGDAGYQGVERREENRTPEVEWHVAMKRGERKALPDAEAGEVQELFERVKASIRAKVEHPFHVVKNLFGHRKVRYRGLAKNEAQLYTLFGLGNLLLAKRR